MADFPSFDHMTEDSNMWQMTREDNALRAPVDGGYEFTRPRSTRPQRRIINSGFTALSGLNYTTMCAFYNTHQTSLAFTYAMPTTGEVITVRFMEPTTDKWSGVGHTALWNVGFKLKEV